MEGYCESLTSYGRLKTLEVKVGDLALGHGHPVRVQTMTTTDTMDTAATVAQAIRCIEAGAELVRITAPSKKEAENLKLIRDDLRRKGYHTPLVADIHFTPNAAEIAARLIEKVRVNPGNYVDKKKFELLEYSDAEYLEEIDRIRERFTPLVRICKEYGTAMRIGTNHGSLSDRIMSRYGDSPMGMVESAMEFLRIARGESYHNIVLSMKSSNPQVMVQAYRLLIQTMDREFGACYPLHLGVTEAGDGEDGRIKSAIGIGTLMEDGIGDTIRVSLTEDPEFEIPVCRDLVKRYAARADAFASRDFTPIPGFGALPYSPFGYRRRESAAIGTIGGKQVPVVVADFSEAASLEPDDLRTVGYRYDASTDKWNIGDAAADLVFTGNKTPGFALPGTLRAISHFSAWEKAADRSHCFPLFPAKEYPSSWDGGLHLVSIDTAEIPLYKDWLRDHRPHPGIVYCLQSSHPHPMASVRRFIAGMMEEKAMDPVLIGVESRETTVDGQLIHFSTEAGALLLDGMGDGIWLMNDEKSMKKTEVSGRTYLEVRDNRQFLNNTSFSILQATRTRISKTEYISCPSCGRTLFDLQETTARIRSVTNHLKGVKIAIMGCIVNGPGEMADADFGYVGSGPGRITLYRGKEVIKRNIDSAIAVEELIGLIRENDAWVDPPPHPETHSPS
jgi:(E)-4-hydroxy-3-methylbut-2-enyl-diphosphate synthase